MNHPTTIPSDTALVPAEINQLLARQGIDGTCEPNAFGGLDFRTPGIGPWVRVARDDNQINVYVFDRHMVQMASATFANMPASVIVATVAAYLTA